MKMKALVVVLVGLVLTGGAVVASKKMGGLTSYRIMDSPQSKKSEFVPREKTLRWYVDQTKARGEKEIILNAPFVDYPGGSLSTHIDDAISAFTAVIAEPVKEEVIAQDTGEILTWYKFQIIDQLSDHNPYDCAQCAAPPADFFPIAKDQFAMSKFGGAVTIDGIKLIMVDPTFPQLELHKRYFLFISRNSFGVATIGVGANGVFGVDASGSMTPLTNNPHSIKDDIKNRFDRSLARVKDHVRNR